MRDNKPSKVKQLEITDLQKLNDSGYIDLYCSYESHFGLTPNVPYTWQTKQFPVLLPAAKGSYLNVVGLMSRKAKIYHKVLQATFNSKKLIAFMDGFAERAIKKILWFWIMHPCTEQKFMAKVEEWKRYMGLFFTILFPITDEPN